MKLVSRALPAAAALTVALLSLCGSAGAANVIVGPSLVGSWDSYECAVPSCTYANDELGGTGTYVTSPVTGAIVRFSLVGGENPGQYRLRTMHPVSDLAFVFSRMSAPVASVPSTGVQSFSTSLPVEAGQAIGLTMSKGTALGFRENVGRLAEWGFEPPEKGQSLAEGPFEELAGFNAEVQPAPTIASLGATSGPTGGGTSVTITGTDLENVTGVSFGGSSAASFKAETEGQLTAVAPASGSAASVSVSVTTVAGTATAPQTFKYEAPPAPAPPAPPVTLPAPPAHCVVPNLAGKKLEAAKKALLGAKCKLGTVKKLTGATAKSGKVSKQGAKPGSKLAVGTKVAVTLKPPKPTAKKHGKK
jgi:hypothetical protein